LLKIKTFKGKENIEYKINKYDNFEFNNCVLEN